MNLQLRTIRVHPAGELPLVRINCRDCDSHVGEDCPTCDNLGEVEVDEVFASDEILDDAQWAAHDAALDARIAARRTEPAQWPPRFPTPAEHAEIAAMQTDYLAMLGSCLRPSKAA